MRGVSALVLAAGMAVAGGAAVAEAPKVATDIAPVQALVRAVMKGAGDPALLVPPGASPHHQAMRPSQARALSGADLVVWVGPRLTPALGRSVDSLAPDAKRLTLSEVAGLTLLPLRENALFEAHSHDHGAEGHEGHDHAAHEGHDHEDHENHDGHDHAAHEGHDDAGHEGHDHAAHEGHDHAEHDDAAHEGHDHAAQDTGAEIDPHLWLDPVNARLWADAIAEALAELDPAQAALYRANAATLKAEIEAAEAEAQQMLTPVQEVPFVVLHDAFHYFEARFGVEARAAVGDGDDSTPGPARIAALREALRNAPPRCAFAEPQADARLVQTVTEGQTVAVTRLDLMGVNEAGETLPYPQMLTELAQDMAACLAD